MHGVLRGRRATIAGAVEVILLAIVLGSGLSGCSSKPSGARAKIVLGTKAQTFASLVAVADKGGFFAKNGVNVEVRSYPSGLAARDGVLAGRIDAAVCSDFAIASASLESTAFRVLCQVSHGTDHQVMVLKGSGIGSPTDFKGKRVALGRRSQLEFVFLRLMISSGVDPASVTLVNTPSSETARALVDGKADAIVTYAELPSSDAAVLGDRAVGLAGSDLAKSYSMLIVTPTLDRDRNADCQSLVRALVDAQAWAEGNPEQAREIAREFVGSKTAMASGWPTSALHVSLSQQALVRVDEAAKWLASQEGAPLAPSLRPLFDARPLAAVDPARVTLLAR
jgi:NitT/TauT family transport system substrate-binding protein